MATESVSDRGLDCLTQEYLVVGRETDKAVGALITGQPRGQSG